ncbi:hypothetical protein BJI67_14615 [Acidihalobacter aeolianus]|uniref:Helix-turn-helix domain-containing protein n=2 Tax=Acidihalobacter aeolianus TaxID=2792603 RepID=A0A1D8KAY1_9GAMM|nr:hypothetical protein BJI67_14615 [Acidihalobacter aeolianus]
MHSVQAAAAFLNVSPQYVIDRIVSGGLAARHDGAEYLIAIEDLQALKATLRRETEMALQALADESRDLGI